MRRLAAAFVRLDAVLVWAALAYWQIGSGPARADDPQSPDAALARVIDKARAEAASPIDVCGRTDIDLLVRIFCRQQIRVGVRDHYPLFGAFESKTWRGYDVDVARAVAAKLGVSIAFVAVDPASRIAALADDQIDLTIATLGHSTTRDGQARFIRPHYYQSQTIVIGPRATPIKGWSDIAGQLICVSVGNGSNEQIIAHGGRLMLFDDPNSLTDGLRSGTCPLAAQDDSFFAFYFLDSEFASRFDTKLAFAPMPWGMAVAREHSKRLATALDSISQIFHRDGVFLKIAGNNSVATAFLQRQREIWNRPDCNIDSGPANTACVLPALDMNLEPTRFAPSVAAFEHWISDTAGVSVALPMFEWAPAWSLFEAGIINSLIVVAGALIATLSCALALAAALESRIVLVQFTARTVIVVMQSSPILLTLVIAAAIAQAFFPYSGAMVLCAAIVALGLTNGSNAGQAIAEAVASLRAEGWHRDSGHIFPAALKRASTQIISFLVNAAKGTPAASFIGAPELLNSLTDITSFSANGRGVTYALVLAFYIAVIAVVIGSCRRLEAHLARRLA